MNDKTVTITWRMEPFYRGPFETEAEAYDTSDLLSGLLNPPAGMFVRQSPVSGKWWRNFWSTTTLPPLEAE